MLLERSYLQATAARVGRLALLATLRGSGRSRKADFCRYPSRSLSIATSSIKAAMVACQVRRIGKKDCPVVSWSLGHSW